MKNKKIFKQLLTLFITFISLNNSVFADGIEVAQILSKPVPHINSMTINGIQEIHDIYTINKFAWAVDKTTNKIAFYNGTSWETAQSIPGIDYFDMFYASYNPKTNTAEAWELNNKAISHFDGTSWETAIPVSDIFLATEEPYSLAIRAARGYALLIKSDLISEQVQYSLYNPTTKTWSESKNLEGTGFFDAGEKFVVSDIENPRFYFSLESNIKGRPPLVIYEIDSNEKLTAMILKGTDKPGSRATLIADKHYLFVQYDQGSTVPTYPMLAFRNPNTANEWQYKAMPKNEAMNLWRPSNESSGLLCMNQFLNGRPTHQIQFNCINSSLANSNWTPPVIINNPTAWDLITHKDGSWLGYHLDADKEPAVILNYDFASHKFIDLNFPSPETITPGSDINIKALSNDLLLACVKNKNIAQSKIRLFINNKTETNTHWVELDTSSSSLLNCNFNTYAGSHVSWGGKKYDGTVWLFNQQR